MRLYPGICGYFVLLFEFQIPASFLISVVLGFQSGSSHISDRDGYDVLGFVLSVQWALCFQGVEILEIRLQEKRNVVLN